MAKKQKIVPLTPEEVEALTTTQHLRRARECSAYWLRRTDRILKLAQPTPRQLESLAWYEQHGLIWGAIAEKLDKLALLEAQERAREYEHREPYSTPSSFTAEWERNTNNKKSPAGEC